MERIERLGKRTVDAAVPAAKRYVIWDSELKGFGLRVEPTGIKTFIVRYRAAGGGRSAPQRQMAVGRMGAVTPDQARKAAEKVIHGATVGQDPAGDLAAQRREMKLSALIDLYEQLGCVVQRGRRLGEPMKAQTKAFTLARLRHHVVPLLGRKRVSEIGPAEVEKMSRDIAEGRTARDEFLPTEPGQRRKRVMVRGGDGAARKVVRDLSAVFSFGIRQKIATANPVEHAAVRKTDNVRDRFLSLVEVKRLGEAFDALEKEGTNPKAINIARLWALTGCRRNEIAGLRWSEVDFERGLLLLDDSKTGKSVRPLGAAALALLAGLDREESCFVFTASTGDSFYGGAKRIWPRVVARAKLPGVTPHTLRHTLGGTATSTGEALALTGAILGHANTRSTAIYAHVANDPARRAADRVTKKIAAALSGAPSATIMSMRRRAK